MVRPISGPQRDRGILIRAKPRVAMVLVGYHRQSGMIRERRRDGNLDPVAGQLRPVLVRVRVRMARRAGIIGRVTGGAIGAVTARWVTGRPEPAIILRGGTILAGMTVRGGMTVRNGITRRGGMRVPIPDLIPGLRVPSPQGRRVIVIFARGGRALGQGIDRPRGRVSSLALSRGFRKKAVIAPMDPDPTAPGLMVRPGASIAPTGHRGGTTVQMDRHVGRVRMGHPAGRTIRVTEVRDRIAVVHHHDDRRCVNGRNSARL